MAEGEPPVFKLPTHPGIDNAHTNCWTLGAPGLSDKKLKVSLYTYAPRHMVVLVMRFSKAGVPNPLASEWVTYSEAESVLVGWKKEHAGDDEVAQGHFDKLLTNIQYTLEMIRGGA